MSVYSTKGVLRSTPAVRVFWPDVKSFSKSLFSFGFDPEADQVLCWGTKPSARRAASLAYQFGVPLVRLEDGFIRSAGLGVAGEPALSLYVDPIGVYYDATKPSLIESVLVSGTGLPELYPQAIEAMNLIVKHGVSKYNQHMPQDKPLVSSDNGAVLVVDQTVGDQSVEKGLAGADSFYRMMNAAKVENPGKTIIVKRHPDVVAGKKMGYLDDVTMTDDMVVISDGNPYDLFLSVDKVYVVTSQLGFEALLAHKPVVCFGAPFYAGWGVTDDRISIPRRGKNRTVAEIFAAAYLVCCRYVDPVTWIEGDIFKVINHIRLQRKKRAANGRRRVVCVGMSWWKHKVVTPFFKGAPEKPKNSSPVAIKSKGADASVRFVVWGNKHSTLPSDLGGQAEVLRMEDGFLRSVGLGSNLVPPISLVVDRQGLYYDATRRSDLEEILATHAFPPELVERAQCLREMLQVNHITKYNLGGRRADLSSWREAGKKLILVVGQVPGDASISFGSNGGPVDDYQLMLAVRADHPEGFIVYKPHPDVVSGNRPGQEAVSAAEKLANIYLHEADTLELIEQCDEVHTMTSLSGFEALIRGKRVVCYGMPFYAGWGLTEDKTTLPEGRRGRLLTVDQLVAAALILYPEYVHPVTKDFITAEDAVQILIRQKRIKEMHTRDIRHGFFNKQFNKIRHLAGQSNFFRRGWPAWMGTKLESETGLSGISGGATCHRCS